MTKDHAVDPTIPDSVHVGPAKIVFRSDMQQFTDLADPLTGFDDVTILPGGALRVANLAQVENRHTTCEVETSSAYYPAGSWLEIRPSALRGTLLVSDEPDGNDPRHGTENMRPVAGMPDAARPLGGLMTKAHARKCARTYIMDTYGIDHRRAIETVAQAFGAQHPVRLHCQHDGSVNQLADAYRRIRFLFVLAPLPPDGPE